MKQALLLCALLLLSGSVALGADKPAAAFPTGKPNIVLILADDYGYGSLGCYGAPADLKTPNLDRLAKQGRRFTNAYAPGSVCSPTRYGLMTGRYYWRTSVKDGEVLNGNAPLHIETDRLTLASLCKSQGYKTAAFGKWHLGMGPAGGKITDWSVPLKPGPLEIGFDSFFGMASNPWSGPHSFIRDHAVTGHIAGEPIVTNGNRAGSTTKGIEQQWDEHQITATLTDEAVKWLEQNSKSTPFFMYFAHTAVHRPVAPNPKFAGSKYGIYGDFIEELDGSVGRLLDTLDRLKLTQDTLVIFTSDNGGVNVMNGEHAIAQNAGLKINGALRGGKHDIWEGGFREPFIVRWPGHVPEGTTSDAIICETDVLATLAGLLGVPLKPGQAEDSFDVREAFFASAPPGEPARDHVILQDARATYAIRQGNWKLIEHANTPKVTPRNQAAARRQAGEKQKPAKDELYNLTADPAETKEVSAEHPDVAARLAKLLVEGRDRGQTR